MKKIKANRKIIIGVIIGIIISVTTSYVLAATLINSQDVVYDDKTSGLGANNVQSAIDKTCSNIDTRLSGIEDNLYTITNIKGSKLITTSTELAYTGATITLPAKSYCTVTVLQSHSGSRPVSISVNTGSTAGSGSFVESGYVSTMPIGRTSVTFSLYIPGVTVYYIWASAVKGGASNYIEWYGWCATKIN